MTMFAIIGLMAGQAHAGPGSGTHGHGHVETIGAPGRAQDVGRTIEITMTDNRYDHADIHVEEGETVRFVVHNRGHLVHEFNIGTPHMHAEHRDEMLAMMASGAMTPTAVMHGGGHMRHDDLNSVLVDPGETEELIWRFRGVPGKLEFACNVPGHYEAGMVGELRVAE